MKNLKTIQVVELSPSECMDISAKGWIIAGLIALGAYIAEDWAAFKNGLADGFASVEL